MAQNLRVLLQQPSLLIGDGAMGTSLIGEGWDFEESCERWNMEEPESIKAIHRSFVEAVSDFIMTNTFGGCPLCLKDDDLDPQTEEINRVAAQLAREAAGEQCLVLGDIGPCGFPLEPVGPARAEDVKAQYP